MVAHIKKICFIALVGLLAFSPVLAQSDLKISKSDQKYLLNLSRQTMEWLFEGKVMHLDSASVPKALQKKIGCYVTLNEQRWGIRGRSGTLNRDQALYLNVIEATLAATREGMNQTEPFVWRDWARYKTEISIVSKAKDLKVSSVKDLLSKLKSKSGVVLYTPYGSSTALPKIWEDFPKVEDFLSQMCWQHRAPEDTWQKNFKDIRVQTFSSFWFRENAYGLEARKVKGAKGSKRPKPHVGVVSGHPFFAHMSDGPTIRIGNSSDSPVTDLKISSDVSIKLLGTGDLLKGQKISSSTKVLKGEYTQAGNKRTILIPAPAKNITLLFRNNGYAVQNESASLPLYPYPQDLQIEAGWCNLKGKSLYLGGSNSKKAEVIAETLSKGLPGKPKTQVGGKTFGDYQILSVGLAPDTWASFSSKIAFDKMHPTLKSQAYAMLITPKGVLIVSPTTRGLSYGALTLMQLARYTVDGTKIPCLNILDWPDAELRGTHAGSPAVSSENRIKAGKICWEGKFTTVLWEIRPTMVGYQTHPEVQLGSKMRDNSGKRKYRKLTDQLNSFGIDFIPMHQASLGHWHQSACLPHEMMGDSETYYWAMTQMMDEDLEAFRPSSFHLMMDEDFFIRRDLFHPSRDITAWRDAAVRLSNYLRRRGVFTHIYSDSLRHASEHGETGRSTHKNFHKLPDSEPFPQNYKTLVSKFPKDIVLNSWYYWPTSPQGLLKGKGGMLYQLESGLPVVGLVKSHLYEQHMQVMKKYKSKFPNAYGAIVPRWGPVNHPKDTLGSIGAFWNISCPDKPLDFKSDLSLAPNNWQELLNTDVPASIGKPLKNITDPYWRKWMNAREEFVAISLPAVPAILEKMSKAEGIIQDRLEGCVSRIARDARQSFSRGKLDVAKVMPFLKDKKLNVRNIAAEVIASADKNNLSKLRSLIGDKIAGSACVHALAIVRDSSSESALISLLGKSSAPIEARAQAAKTLGWLNAPAAKDALIKALSSGKADLQREAIWALAILREKSADKEIAKFITSKDQDLRYRAVMALTVLKSPETKKVVSWLGKERQSLELAAWSMYKTWNKKEASAAASSAAKKQKDPLSKKRLEQLKKVFVGKSKRKAKYR